MDNPVYRRLLEPPAASFFLFGPRGTGKSTWLRARFPDALHVDLLDESRYQAYLVRPGLLGEELAVVPRSQTVVLDEVQRLPPLLNEVHRQMESVGRRFVLCGSSARKLKTAGTNLLAGRAVRRFMHPLLPEEMGGDFDLDDALRVGTLPVVLGAPDRAEALEAYAQMYLREEVQAEAIVRNLAGFARFLPIAALFHGQTVNVSSAARDAGVARTTVQGYLEVLEDTLLAYRLPAWTGRLRVRETRHPKLYLADAGIVRALKRARHEPGPEEMGHLFEGWVASVLRAYRDVRSLFDEWHFWSSAGSRVEVDFLLHRGTETVAIDVKSGDAVRKADLRGLRAVADVAGVVRRLVVYRGPRSRQTEDGIDVLPVAAFLEELAAGTLFPG